MSISPIGGASLQSMLQVPSAAKPESAEVPGAPDHDGDSDDTGTSAALTPGSVDLTA
jgi:hypothetical protein